MYLTPRFYLVLMAVAAVMAAGYAWAPLLTVGQALLCLLVVAVVAETAVLYGWRAISAVRTCPERLSNGDDNEIDIRVESTYPFGTRLTITDKLPFVFQRRDVAFALRLGAGSGATVTYSLRPVQRGVYGFGHIRVFATTAISLVQRRYTCGAPQDARVYPAYQQLRHYELLAISNRLQDMGIKRIRRAGNNTEFEQIKEYVQGDEFRTINWKASARHHQLMVNVYQAERSQQVFCVIDKGRVMQRAFGGMTLLDYAVNASLVLSYVAIHKADQAGLITFNERMDTLLAPSRRPAQMERIMESLYAVRTDFGETDYSALVAGVEQRVSKRSLLILFTNFTDGQSLDRQLPYLCQVARRHRLLVVYFENSALHDYLGTRPHSTEDYYTHVVAQQMERSQQLIVSRLAQRGILSLRTTPDRLSVDVINKYLEIKQNEW